MAFFWPWISKIYTYARQAAIRDAVLQKGHRIFAGNANIIDVVFFQRHQQVTDPWLVHFNSNEVFFRFLLRHLPGRFTIAKAYFKDDIS